MAGIELATAYVSLVVEGSKVAPGVKDALGTADTEAARSGERAGKSFTSKFGSALKIGASLAAGFATVQGVKFLGDAIAEAQEASVVGRRTANVIKSMGGASNVTARQVSELAGAISNKVGVDDEAIQSGQNMLLTFGKIRNEVGKGNDIFDQTSQLMVDMSVAMGQDMQSSAVQLGKALNDPIKGVSALSRVGVSFTEQQKEQIKALVETGDVMSAQKVILGEVQKQFGGAAESMTTPAQRAEVAWGNLKEQIGEKLLPVAERLSNWLANKAIPAVSRFIEQMETGRGAGGDFADALRTIRDVGGDAADVARDAFNGFNNLPGWVKEVLTVGTVGGVLTIKAASLLGGFKGGLGSLFNIGKPLPVFVTNPGFGGAPGDGPGKGGGKGGALKNFGLTGGAVLVAGGTAYLIDKVQRNVAPKAHEKGISGTPNSGIGFQGLFDEAKMKGAFEQIVKAQTGMKDLTEATAAYDGIIAQVIRRDPESGFRQLSTFSKQTGVSMKDLTELLPKAGKAIEDTGARARTAGERTREWKDIIVGTGREVDRVDGKKPTVPFAFPDLLKGLNNTDRLGGKVDETGRKKPRIPFTFPGLLPGIADAFRLDRALDEATRTRTAIINIKRQGGFGVLPGMPIPKAAGGPTAANTTYLVGERGPELFVSRQAGRIVPNHQLASSASTTGAASGLSDRDISRLAVAIGAEVFAGTRAGVADRASSAYARRRTG